MKHNYLFLLAFLVISFTQAQIVNIPDEYFKGYVLALGDLNNDDELQVSEAELFTDLNLMFQPIYSLEGINSFINLETLNCASTNLTSLDVSSLTSLRVLHCSNNPLTSLNVNNALSLEVLNISHNQLTNIDLSDLINLKTLTCHYNQLTDLDVSNSIILESLRCNNNQLVNLDLSSLTSLLGVVCSFNELTNLNLESSTGLISLFCNSNSISTLNITGLSNLERLNYSDNLMNNLDFTTLVGLNTLSCVGNEIVNLDISNLTSLEALNCNFNNIQNLDLTNQINLHEVYCYNNQLDNLDLRNGFNYLTVDFNAQNNPNLICIYVDDKDAGFLSSWQIDSTASFVEDEEECMSLSSEEYKMADISIYPNPVSDELTIESKSVLETISIFDVHGRKLQTNVLDGNTKKSKVDLSRLSKGVYFISIKTEVGIQTSKIIKE